MDRLSLQLRHPGEAKPNKCCHYRSGSYLRLVAMTAHASTHAMHYISYYIRQSNYHRKVSLNHGLVCGSPMVRKYKSPMEWTLLTWVQCHHLNYAQHARLQAANEAPKFSKEMLLHLMPQWGGMLLSLVQLSMPHVAHYHQHSITGSNFIVAECSAEAISMQYRCNTTGMIMNGNTEW